MTCVCHKIALSTLTLRPWRLLTAVYAVPLLLAAIWMTRAEESPKFLVAKGKYDEALAVLKIMFEKNKELPAEEFCVTSLKTTTEEDDSFSTDDAEVLIDGQRSMTALSLLRPPHLKWLVLTGFLIFGLFSVLNGLFLFATDTVNKAMKDNSSEEGTLCIIMNQAQNQTNAGCDDHISNDTFLLMVTTTLVYGLIVLGVSVCPVSKKTLLFGMFTVNGVACLLSGLLTNRMVAGAAMSALQLTSLGVGPLTAYAVQLFPTSLRGTVVGAVLMCGRLGSVVGANAAGYFLALACSSTFYTFTAILLVCAVLSLLLPKEERPSTSLEPT
ncbi:sugar transporter domain-containing protein [Phthorimaea operculella]|nr:sugar transporter domain-containing protein [Phthorimaea operculella]